MEMKERKDIKYIENILKENDLDYIDALRYGLYSISNEIYSKRKNLSRKDIELISSLVIDDVKCIDVLSEYLFKYMIELNTVSEISEEDEDAN